MNNKEQINQTTLKALEVIFGYHFNNLQLVQRALTHGSASQSTKENYQQLEFLGDAVLDLAISHLLIDEYPNSSEGALSKMRAALVNKAFLADLARQVNIGNFIVTSKYELSVISDSILADVFEAVVGAIYLDGGFAPCLKLANSLLGEKLKTVCPNDPKTDLQELLHLQGQSMPTYTLEKQDGPEHAPVFYTSLTIDGVEFGKGVGSSKKSSQQLAAAEALKKIKEQKI
jgi:ribonuclease-3